MDKDERKYEIDVPFNIGFDSGYHDGYLACEEKYLQCIDNIKLAVKSATSQSESCKCIAVNAVLDIIDEKLNDIIKGE